MSSIWYTMPVVQKELSCNNRYDYIDINFINYT